MKLDHSKFRPECPSHSLPSAQSKFTFARGGNWYESCCDSLSKQLATSNSDAGCWKKFDGRTLTPAFNLDELKSSAHTSPGWTYMAIVSENGDIVIVKNDHSDLKIARAAQGFDPIDEQTHLPELRLRVTTHHPFVTQSRDPSWIGDNNFHAHVAMEKEIYLKNLQIIKSDLTVLAADKFAYNEIGRGEAWLQQLVQTRQLEQMLQDAISTFEKCAFGVEDNFDSLLSNHNNQSTDFPQKILGTLASDEPRSPNVETNDATQIHIDEFHRYLQNDNSSSDALMRADAFPPRTGSAPESPSFNDSESDDSGLNSPYDEASAEPELHVTEFSDCDPTDTDHLNGINSNNEENTLKLDSLTITAISSQLAPPADHGGGVPDKDHADSPMLADSTYIQERRNVTADEVIEQCPDSPPIGFDRHRIERAGNTGAAKRKPTKRAASEVAADLQNYLDHKCSSAVDTKDKRFWLESRTMLYLLAEGLTFENISAIKLRHLSLDDSTSNPIRFKLRVEKSALNEAYWVTLSHQSHMALKEYLDFHKPAFDPRAVSRRSHINVDLQIRLIPGNVQISQNTDWGKGTIPLDREADRMKKVTSQIDADLDLNKENSAEKFIIDAMRCLTTGSVDATRHDRATGDTGDASSAALPTGAEYQTAARVTDIHLPSKEQSEDEVIEGREQSTGPDMYSTDPSKQLADWLQTYTSSGLFEPTSPDPLQVQDTISLLRKYGQQVKGKDPTEFFAAWKESKYNAKGFLDLIDTLNYCVKISPSHLQNENTSQ